MQLGVSLESAHMLIDATQKLLSATRAQRRQIGMQGEIADR